MSTAAESRARPVSAAAAGLARLRRGSMAVLVLIVLEYGIGMYVNLYVSVPAADHGRSPGSAIANGPVMLSVHIVIGLLLALGAVGVLAQAVVARRPRAIAATAAGLFAVAVAAVAGAATPAMASPPSRWRCRFSPGLHCCATRQTFTGCPAPSVRLVLIPPHPERDPAGNRLQGAYAFAAFGLAAFGLATFAGIALTNASARITQSAASSGLSRQASGRLR